MDIVTARSRLTAATREKLGEAVTLWPMKAGEMAVSQDTDRAALVGVMGRFDIDPDVEVLGGEKRGLAQTRFVGRRATCSVPRSSLAWLPQQYDRLSRDGFPGDGLYEVSHVMDDLPGVILLLLSKVGGAA